MFENFSLKTFFGQEEILSARENVQDHPLVDVAELQAEVANVAANAQPVALGQVFDEVPADEVYTSQASINFWDVVQGKSNDMVFDNAANDHVAEPPPLAPSVYEQAVSELNNTHPVGDTPHFNIDVLNDILNPVCELYDI